MRFTSSARFSKSDGGEVFAFSGDEVNKFFGKSPHGLIIEFGFPKGDIIPNGDCPVVVGVTLNETGPNPSGEINNGVHD
jgi:hypothetical protein